MSSRRAAAVIAAFAAAAVIAAFAWYLGSGARYRLYSSAYAGDCWRALELTTLETATLELARVGAPVRSPDGRVHVTIMYTMDRVLGGRTLEVACQFAAGGGLETVEFDGVELDAQSLEMVNRTLYGE